VSGGVDCVKCTHGRRTTGSYANVARTLRVMHHGSHRELAGRTYVHHDATI
jgi:hypothetical protein